MAIRVTLSDADVHVTLATAYAAKVLRRMGGTPQADGSWTLNQSLAVFSLRPFTVVGAERAPVATPKTTAAVHHTCGHQGAVWQIRDSSGVAGLACRHCAGLADFEHSVA